MRQSVLHSKSIKIAMSAIFTSLVFAATLVFSSYVPQTTGFLNIGKTMVYTTAILFGPLTSVNPVTWSNKLTFYGKTI